MAVGAVDPSAPDADVRTLADLPFHVMGRVPRPQAIGRCSGGAIAWQSSKELFERIRDISLGLWSLGVREGDRVAILSESRPEWLICDLAILSGGAITV